MILGIVGTLNVANLELSRAIHIDLSERFLHKVLSNGAHFACYGSHELIIADLAAVIGVKQVEHLAALFGADGHPEVAQRFPELLDVERAAPVVVHDLEDALHAEQTPSAPRRQLLAEGRHQLLVTLLNPAVVDPRRPLSLRHPGHIRLRPSRHIFAATGGHHVAAIAPVGVRPCRACLPLALGAGGPLLARIVPLDKVLEGNLLQGTLIHLEYTL